MLTTIFTQATQLLFDTFNVISSFDIINSPVKLTDIRQQDNKFSRVYKSEPLIFISHRWINKDNPDPDGSQWSDIVKIAKEHPNHVFFYDFWSIPQKPRTNDEEQQFKRALNSVDKILIKSKVVCLLTEDYFSRTWCVFEQYFENNSLNFIMFLFTLTFLMQTKTTNGSDKFIIIKKFIDNYITLAINIYMKVTLFKHINRFFVGVFFMSWTSGCVFGPLMMLIIFGLNLLIYLEFHELGSLIFILGHTTSTSTYLINKQLSIIIIILDYYLYKELHYSVMILLI